MSYSLALLKWVCGFNWLQCDCLCEWAKLWLWGSSSQSSRQNNHSGVNRLLVFSRLPSFNLIQSAARKKSKRKKTTSITFSKNGMAPAQGWDVSSVLPHLQWGAPIPLPHHSSDGLRVHVGAQSSPEHKCATGPQCWECREGIKPSSLSLRLSPSVFREGMGRVATAAPCQCGRQQTTAQFLLNNSWLLRFWDVHSFFWMKSH